MSPSLTSCLLTSLIPLGFKAGVSSIASDTSPLGRRPRELLVDRAVLPAWPSITPLRESHVWSKSDFLQPCVDIPMAQAAFSEECMHGFLSCGHHQDGLIWLNLPVIRCAASEPCWILLPIRAQWADVPARTPSHMPNPEHCWR